MTSWRDVLPIHPAADLFPMMSPDELRALGEDIKRNGLKQPIVLFQQDEWPGYALLDGRNRLDAMEMVGIEVLNGDSFGGVLHPSNVRTTDAPRSVDPFAYVLSLNVHRRHLTAEQRRDLIAKVMKAKPEASNRQIAEQVKADHRTVGKVRKELEATGEVPQLEKTTGTDGKARRTKPKRSKPPAADPTQNKALSRPEGIMLEVWDLLAGTSLNTVGYFDKIKDLPPNDQCTAAKRDLRMARRCERKMRRTAVEPRQIDLEEAIAAKEVAAPASAPAPVAPSKPTAKAVETFVITVADIKADLLRFSDEDLEDLRHAIEGEIAERKAMAVRRTGA